MMPLESLQGNCAISKSVFTPQYQLFLEKLRLAREVQGLTQREVGRRLGRHHNFVSSCEMGDRVLNFVEVRDWCRALEINWVEFTQMIDENLEEIGDQSSSE